MDILVDKIRSFDIEKATDEIIRMGDEIEAGTNEEIYWELFYVVANVILGRKYVFDRNNHKQRSVMWKMPVSNFRILIEEENKNYDQLLTKDDEHEKILNYIHH